MSQINQQRSRTIPKNTSPEYTSLLHFPGVDKNDLSKLHMHIAILGFVQRSIFEYFRYKVHIFLR